MKHVAAPADHRAGRGRQGDHVLQGGANDAGRQGPVAIVGVGNVARDAGRQQEHAAILNRGVGQRDPDRQERVTALAVVVVRAPAGDAPLARNPMGPDHGVLHVALADRRLEEGCNLRRPRDAPEFVEDEGEGDRPAIGANGLDDAPHPCDPRSAEHLR